MHQIFFTTCDIPCVGTPQGSIMFLGNAIKYYIRTIILETVQFHELFVWKHTELFTCEWSCYLSKIISH